MAPYFNAVQKYLAGKPELFALSHVNLQIDNAWFWRSKVIKSTAQTQCTHSTHPLPSHPPPLTHITGRREWRL